MCLRARLRYGIYNVHRWFVSLILVVIVDAATVVIVEVGGGLLENLASSLV